jgi:type I restriction enzyme S subunit
MAIGEVGSVFDGPHATPKTVDEGPIFLSISTLQDGVVNLDETRHVTPEDFAKWTRRVTPQAGDVVFSYETRLGQIAVIPEDLECCLGRRMGLVRFRDGLVTPRFFAYQYLSPPFRQFLETRTIHGATVDRISIKEFPSFRITVPPVAEQGRIVGILDEVFEGIATAQTNADRNLQNAEALFQGYLQSIFQQECEDWVPKRLADISRINYGYTESSSNEKVGPKFLRITDIQNDRVDWDSVPYCSIDSNDFPKYQLSDGDIVFVRTGSTTGKSFLVTDPPEAVFASYLIRVQVNVNELLPGFVNLFFKTTSYWESIWSGVSGSAQGGFNATKLGELVLSYPRSQGEQLSIVQRADEMVRETQRLQAIHRRKLAALEELRKSLLHEAFTGRLGARVA